MSYGCTKHLLSVVTADLPVLWVMSFQIIYRRRPGPHRHHCCLDPVFHSFPCWGSFKSCDYGEQLHSPVWRGACICVVPRWECNSAGVSLYISGHLLSWHCLLLPYLGEVHTLGLPLSIAALLFFCTNGVCFTDQNCPWLRKGLC